jgi:hypothetical protein
MAKRISEPKARPKRPRDPNQLAHQLIQEQTGQASEVNQKAKKVPAAISRYMAALGRQGGKVGGARRAANMTAEERSNAAALAARAKWAKPQTQNRSEP